MTGQCLIFQNVKALSNANIDASALGSLGLHYDRKEFGFLSAFGHVHISHLFAKTPGF